MDCRTVLVAQKDSCRTGSAVAVFQCDVELHCMKTVELRMVLVQVDNSPRTRTDSADRDACFTDLDTHCEILPV